jgi:hypothetical protein
VSVLEELKSKPWFPWAVGAGVILFLFWLHFWSTPGPGPLGTDPLRLPPDIRKVWIVDHPNEAGDLIPGHWVFMVGEHPGPLLPSFFRQPIVHLVGG